MHSALLMMKHAITSQKHLNRHASTGSMSRQAYWSAFPSWCCMKIRLTSLCVCCLNCRQVCTFWLGVFLLSPFAQPLWRPYPVRAKAALCRRWRPVHHGAFRTRYGKGRPLSLALGWLESTAACLWPKCNFHTCLQTNHALTATPPSSRIGVAEERVISLRTKMMWSMSAQAAASKERHQ